MEFTSGHGFSGVIDGVTAGASRRTTDRVQRTTNWTQDATCASIAVEVSGAAPPKHTVEWIANFQTNRFIWFGSVAEEAADESTITFGEGDGAIKLSAKGKDMSSRSEGVSLLVGGWELYLASADHPNPGIRAPGYIVYRGAPDETTRRKIRDCLSFALGLRLVYLGSAVLDENDTLQSFFLVNGNQMSERVFDLPPMPPAPLEKRYRNEVDQPTLSRVVNGLYACSDSLGFRSLSWQYWHAATAPVHTAAAHYGAAIEALRSAYRKVQPTKFRTRIISEKEKWEKLYEKLLAAVDEGTLDEGAGALIRRKLHNLDDMPAPLVSEQVFAVLGLELGVGEQRAWKSRNTAAHGSSTSENPVETIKNAKLLRLLFHRLLLKVTNGSDVYRDYHAIGHPVRRLQEPAL